MMELFFTGGLFFMLPLLVASVAVVAIGIERFVRYRRAEINYNTFLEELTETVRDEGVPAARTRAAEILKLTTEDLMRMGIIDEVIPEPLGGAHRDSQATARAVEEAILRNREELVDVDGEEIVERRLAKFRAIGVFSEDGEKQP